MSEWRNVTLGHLSTQRKGINYKSEDYGDEHSGHPFITIKCFVKGGGYEPTGIKFYDGFSTKADQLSPGDILFSVTDLTRAGDIVGSPLRVPDFGGAKPALASMDCMRIEAVAGRCHSGFLYHRLMLSDVRRQMVAYSAGSTVLHLHTKKVPSISVRVPVDVRIQSQIAMILDGLDTAIEKTEALNDKYQQIKSGLMHDLFTRGVLPNGQLRPPREQAPELYQETAIGWIPEEWRVGVLGDFSDIHNSLRKPLASEIRETMKGEYPYYGPTGVIDYINEFLVEGEFCLIGEDGDHFLKYQEWLMTQLVSGRFNVNNHAHILSGKNGASTRWLHEFFKHRDITFHLTRQGAGRYKLNKAALLKLPIVVPAELEQNKLANHISCAELYIDSLARISQKLAKKKLGLMQDLLTGKVPVKLDEPEPADA